MREGEMKPALTAEEWADGSKLGTPENADAFFHRQMAIYNHALPEGHPGKLTRADVEKLALAADMIPEMDDVIEAIAAKLAALLPPTT